VERRVSTKRINKIDWLLAFDLAWQGSDDLL
jgi:hypothetical protein